MLPDIYGYPRPADDPEALMAAFGHRSQASRGLAMNRRCAPPIAVGVP